MSVLQYAVPGLIKVQCDQAKYSRWLQRKAVAHVKRERKRARPCTVAQHKRTYMRPFAGREARIFIRANYSTGRWWAHGTMILRRVDGQSTKGLLRCSRPLTTRLMKGASQSSWFVR